MRRPASLTSSVAFVMMLAASPALGQAVEEPSADDKAFRLGQIIIVTGQRPEGVDIGGSTVNSEAIYTFNRNRLDEAANLIPGVSSSNTGGSRNERLMAGRCSSTSS